MDQRINKFILSKCEMKVLSVIGFLLVGVLAFKQQ